MKKKEVGIVIAVVLVALLCLAIMKNTGKPATDSKSEDTSDVEETSTPVPAVTSSPVTTQETEATTDTIFPNIDEEESQESNEEQETEEPFVSASGAVVAIQWRNTIVQEFDPYVDAVYDVDGDVGGLQVEVKDGKWHVTNEQCPNHVCADMGWVSLDDIALPITCLPNNVIVFVEEYGDE